jgi:osmotically-inducible protein OsmY
MTQRREHDTDQSQGQRQGNESRGSERRDQPWESGEDVGGYRSGSQGYGSQGGSQGSQGGYGSQGGGYGSQGGSSSLGGQGFGFQGGMGGGMQSFGGGQSSGYGSSQGYGSGQQWSSGTQGQVGSQGTSRFRGKGPKGYSRSDERLREELSEKLMENPEIDASEVEINVTDGEVTLTGTVDSRNSKRMIEDLCEDVLGVKHVQNNVRLKKGDSSSGQGSSQGQSSSGQGSSSSQGSGSSRSSGSSGGSSGSSGSTGGSSGSMSGSGGSSSGSKSGRSS